MRGRRPESPEPEAAKMSEAPSGPLLPTQTLGRQEEHPHRDSRPPVSSPRDRKETLLRCPAVHTHPREHLSTSATSSPVSPHVLMCLPRAPGPHSSPQAVLLLIKIRDPFPFSGSPSIPHPTPHPPSRPAPFNAPITAWVKRQAPQPGSRRPSLTRALALTEHKLSLQRPWGRMRSPSPQATCTSLSNLSALLSLQVCTVPPHGGRYGHVSLSESSQICLP